LGRGFDRLFLADVRRIAMTLLGTTESPHHRYTSFRVRGRIYATAPAEGGSLHVFVDEEDRDRMVKLYPGTYAILGWGKKVVGLRVDLVSAQAGDVGALLRAAWQRKTGKR
jgi:YjbR